MLAQEASQDRNKGNVVMLSSPPVMNEMNVDTEDDDATPCPNMHASRFNNAIDGYPGEEVEMESEDDESFETPLALRKYQATRIIADSDNPFDEETDKQEVSAFVPVRVRLVSIMIINLLTGKHQFRSQVFLSSIIHSQ